MHTYSIVQVNKTFFFYSSTLWACQGKVLTDVSSCVNMPGMEQSVWLLKGLSSNIFHSHLWKCMGIVFHPTNMTTSSVPPWHFRHYIYLASDLFSNHPSISNYPCTLNCLELSANTKFSKKLSHEGKIQLDLHTSPTLCSLWKLIEIMPSLPLTSVGNLNLMTCVQSGAFLFGALKVDKEAWGVFGARSVFVQPTAKSL